MQTNPLFNAWKPREIPYAYIAIEGNIGTGKTTFATWLVEHLGGDLLLEQFQENRFWRSFTPTPSALP